MDGHAGPALTEHPSRAGDGTNMAHPFFIVGVQGCAPVGQQAGVAHNASAEVASPFSVGVGLG